MIERSCWSSIVADIEKPTITLLMGARQTGKTTLLTQLRDQVDASGRKTAYLTLEDKLVLEKLNDHPEELFKFIPKHEPITVFIDEIQYLSDPTNFLKYIYDLYKNELKLVVTGSSAFYINQSFKDSLAGRKRIFHIQTYDFKEFLKSKQRDDLVELIKGNQHPPFVKRSFLIPNRRELETYMAEYIIFGGYPDVVNAQTKEEKISRLTELHQSFLQKDFLEAGIKHPEKAYYLLRILANQIGQLVNTQELANTVDLAHDTVKQYIYILEKSFIIRVVRPFFNNVRKELTKMPKGYFLDLGFRNIVLKNFETMESRADKGVILENLIYKFLLFLTSSDIRFWRTQARHEVDFILDEKFAYESKFSVKQVKPSKYQKFQKEYPQIPLEYIFFSSEADIDLMDIAQ